MGKAKEIYEMITADYFPAESLEHRRTAIMTLGRMARKGNREAIGRAARQGRAAAATPRRSAS